MIKQDFGKQVLRFQQTDVFFQLRELCFHTYISFHATLLAIKLSRTELNSFYIRNCQNSSDRFTLVSVLLTSALPFTYFFFLTSATDRLTETDFSVFSFSCRGPSYCLKNQQGFSHRVWGEGDGGGLV